MMDDFALRARLSLAESLREQTRRTPGGTVVDEDGILLFRSTVDFPVGYFNGCMRTDDDVPADEVVGRATSFFGDRGFTLWVEGQGPTDLDKAAVSAGLQLIGGDRAALRFDLEATAEAFGRPDRRDVRHGTVQLTSELKQTTIGHLAPLASVGDARVNDQVRLRTVATESDASDFVAVAAAAYAIYGTPEEAVAASLGRLSSLRGPNLAAVVAYYADDPVATAMVYVSYGVACVTWVSSHPTRAAASSATTVREDRFNTVAGLCTVAASLLGYAMGASWVAGPATRLGERLYRRLGGSVFTTHRWYARSTGS